MANWMKKRAFDKYVEEHNLTYVECLAEGEGDEVGQYAEKWADGDGKIVIVLHDTISGEYSIEE